MFPGHRDTAAARGGVALLSDGRAAHADRQGQAQAEDRPQGQAQARVQALQWPQEQVSLTARYFKGYFSEQILKSGDIFGIFINLWYYSFAQPEVSMSFV